MNTTLDTEEGAFAHLSKVSIAHEQREATEPKRPLLHLKVGQEVEGRYRILRELGRGGNGVVYAAFDPKLDREIALKLIRESGRKRSAVIQEARALAAVKHPNVVTIHDVGTTEAGLTFLSMELVEGPSMRRWLESERSVTELRRVFADAGRGCWLRMRRASSTVTSSRRT